MTGQSPTPIVSPDGFRWMREPWGAVLKCQALEGIAYHAFTTRQLRLGSAADTDGDGWAEVARLVDVGPERLRRVAQVHGDSAAIFRCAATHAAAVAPRTEADMLTTDDGSLALAVQTADCVPLLLADAHRPAVAAVHAGWRGTALGIARRAVGVLAREFGARAGDIVAAIGPSIGPCCYQVGGELREAFLEAGHSRKSVERWFTSHSELPAGLRLDLWRATRDQLIDAGLDPARIHVSALCTATHGDLFYSYRRDGAGTGRMAGVIRMRTDAAVPGSLVLGS